MKSIVIYYSKSGNTKKIAEYAADILRTEALSLNLISKKGRGTKEEQDKEKKLFNSALKKSKNVDLVIIGTPTSFQKAHSKIIRFSKKVETKNIGLFCTHYNQFGTTFADLEAILKDRDIKIINTLEFDNLKPGQFLELDKSAQNNYFKKLKDFVKVCKLNC